MGGGGGVDYNNQMTHLWKDKTTEKIIHQTNNKIDFDVMLQLLPCFQTFLSWKEDKVS